MLNTTSRALLTSLLLGSASSIVLIAHALAEQAQQAAKPEAVQVDIADVVVSAEKRETALQKTPAAITALSGSVLEKANIKSVVDLNGVVPGLTVTPNEGWSRVVAIRGVGYETAQNSIAQPSTAFHVDGVYVVNPVSLQQNFLDVKRVEIERGPQGTVYGQNAVGGTINVVTNQPDLFRAGGSSSVGYGTYNLVDTNGVVNVPIVEGELAARAAFAYLRHEGFAKATPLGGYGLDDANNVTGRIELLWAPTNDFSALLSSQIYNADTHDAALKNINDPNSDPRRLTQDYPGQLVTRQYIEALTLKWNLDWATLKSISSYQHAYWRGAFDNDRLDWASYPTRHDIMPHTSQSNDSWTQEVNVASPTGGSLDWIAGGFYLHTTNKARVVEYYNTFAGQPTPDLLALPASGLPANFGYGVNAVTTRESYSGYGQATLHLTDALRLTGGLRYTHDRVDGRSLSYFGLFGPAALASITGDKVTGKAALEYDLTHDNLVYASWSRGFKPGGTNLNQNPTLVQTTFQPETVDSFEIGSKNRFLDNSLTLNSAAFYYNYRNFQFIGDDPVPYQGGVSNIPGARVFGIETEFTALLPYDLRLEGNAAAMKSEITSDFSALDSVAAAAAANASGCGPWDNACRAAARAGAIRNIKGNPLPKAPSFAGSLALAHSYRFEDGGELTSRVQYVYQGDFVYRVFNDSALDKVPGYGLWNAYFDYAPPSSNWKFSVTATNLFDTNAITSRFTNAFGIGTTANQYVPPRQVFGRISYSF